MCVERKKRKEKEGEKGKRVFEGEVEGKVRYHTKKGRRRRRREEEKEEEKKKKKKKKENQLFEEDWQQGRDKESPHLE